jgi:RNA polymerase sigma-70 factor (ECF subfamily)
VRYSADFLGKSPESVLVGLARTGNRDAYAEIVSRRQNWVRNLMRRCCRDPALADDLAQQVFMQGWQSLRQLEDPNRFAAWLKRMAINLWLQHKRRNDPLRDATPHSPGDATTEEQPAIAMDLDRALATLADDVRLCVVLGYHERMTHNEIVAFTGLPLGTVKSHIRRGTQKLRQELAAYLDINEEST